MNQDSTIRSPGADDRQTTASGGLALYELQRPLVEPFNPLPTHLDLGALTNPEGSILVVDATLPPYVERFDDMTKFVSYANGPSVGSSARAATAGAPQHQFVHSVQPAGRGTG